MTPAVAATAGFTRIFDNEALVPAAWRDRRGQGFRTFNPTVLQRADGHVVMVYRVVSEALGRKLAACLLDERLDVVPGSVVPLSDRLRFPPGRYGDLTQGWHADARFAVLDGLPHLCWNDGYKRPHNHQFLVAFDAETLSPGGEAIALTRPEGRQAIEKNWGLFFDGGIRAIYSPSPFTVLHAAGEADAELPFRATHTGGASAHPALAELRGGASPVWLDGAYWHVCHAVVTGPDGLRHYRTAAYTFTAGSEPRVLRQATRFIDLPNPHGDRTLFDKLNPKTGEVVYACGALALAQCWLIAYGINDERCALHLLPQSDLDGHLSAAT